VLNRCRIYPILVATKSFWPPSAHEEVKHDHQIRSDPKIRSRGESSCSWSIHALLSTGSDFVSKRGFWARITDPFAPPASKNGSLKHVSSTRPRLFLGCKKPAVLVAALAASRVTLAPLNMYGIFAISRILSMGLSWIMHKASIQMYLRPSFTVARIASRMVRGSLSTGIDLT